jgi:hypothetical protein
MESGAYAIGQAIFLRTDTVDYAEESVPFRSLEEMVDVCSTPHPNLTLEKVIVYSMVNDEPSALTLGFIAASKGQRPANLELAEKIDGVAVDP